MDSLYEDLFWYLDHDEDGALDFFEFQEGLQDLGVSHSLEDDEVGFMKAQIDMGSGPLERAPEAEWSHSLDVLKLGLVL